MHALLAKVPNALSASRLVLLPVLGLLAWHGMRAPFLIVLCCSLATDSVDGLIARKLNVASDLGARLDSVGDLATYMSLPIMAYWLWPDIIRQEAHLVLPLVLSYVLPVLTGYLKYHRLPSYHTWAAKLSAVLMGGSLILLFAGITPLPFRLFAVVPVLAGAEEMMITLTLPDWHADIPSLLHARRLRARQQA